MKFLEIESHPFDREGSVAMVVILTVAAMHTYQAWLLYLNPMALGATNLTAVLMAFRFMHIANGIPCLQAIMCLAAAIAIFGSLLRVGWFRLIGLIPQNAILGAMGWGGVIAAIHGSYLDGTRTYPDGTPIGWEHINADQIGYLVLFSIHSWAIFRKSWDHSNE